MRYKLWAHIIPDEDMWDHYLDGRDCWCQPEYDENEQVVLHNSMDMREYFDALPRTLH